MTQALNELEEVPNPPSQSSALICEVDFRVQGNRLVFEYSGMARVDLGQIDFHEVLEELAAGTFQDFSPPRGTRRRSRLSIDFPEDSYLVMLLKRDKDWQFSRQGPLFTVGDPSGEAGTHPRLVNPRAVGTDGVEIGPRTDGAACQLAYCIGFRGPDGTEERFNLHVDINEEDSVDEQGRYIPIVIDPDVGHPGGGYP